MIRLGMGFEGWSMVNLLLHLYIIYCYPWWMVHFCFVFCFDERTCEAASTVSWPQPNLSFEVLAEYVWLDADGVTRSKTMTMTARWGAVGVRSGIQNPEQDSHHVSEHRVVMTQRSILC